MGFATFATGMDSDDDDDDEPVVMKGKRFNAAFATGMGEAGPITMKGKKFAAFATGMDSDADDENIVMKGKRPVVKIAAFKMPFAPKPKPARPDRRALARAAWNNEITAIRMQERALREKKTRSALVKGALAGSLVSVGAVLVYEKIAKVPPAVDEPIEEAAKEEKAPATTAR